MAELLCKICSKRRPRRHCPALEGDICPQCCGEQREVTIACPLDCDYLIEARAHEKPPALRPEDIPNGDIRVPDEFLRENEPLVYSIAHLVLQGAMDTPSAVDLDVRETLAALIKTQRTLDSGLIYESRPENTIAAEMQSKFTERFTKWRDEVHEKAGLTIIKEQDVLKSLVFIERLELQMANGRPKGRAFIDFLHGWLMSMQLRANAT